MAAECTPLVVVIPANNEAATIRAVVLGVLAYVPRIIIVDDGSTDSTAAALTDLPITVLQNQAKLGKAASLWRGIDVALAEGAGGVITLDGDGQHDPRDLPRLIGTFLAEHGAIIIGSRLHARDLIPRVRYCANRFANFWISWAAGQAIADTQCGYRIYPIGVLRALRLPLANTEGFVLESEILIEAGRRGVRIVAVPVTAIYPRGRRSRFRPVADIALIVRMVAWKLISRGFYLKGLVRYWRQASDGAVGRAEVKSIVKSVPTR